MPKKKSWLEHMRDMGLILAVFNPVAVALLGFSEIKKDNTVQDEKITYLGEKITYLTESMAEVKTEFRASMGEMKQDLRDRNIYFSGKPRSKGVN